MNLLGHVTPRLSVFIVKFPLALAINVSLVTTLVPLVTPFYRRLFDRVFGLLTSVVDRLPLVWFHGICRIVLEVVQGVVPAGVFRSAPTTGCLFWTRSRVTAFALLWSGSERVVRRFAK